MTATLGSTWLAVATAVSATFTLPANDTDRAWCRLAAAASAREISAFSGLRENVVVLETVRLEERGARQLEQISLPSAVVRTYVGPPTVRGRTIPAVFYAVLEPLGDLEPPTMWELVSAYPGSFDHGTVWFLIVHGCDLPTGDSLMGFAKSWRLAGSLPPSYAEFRQAVTEIFERHGEYPANTGVASSPNKHCLSVDGLSPIRERPP